MTQRSSFGPSTLCLMFITQHRPHIQVTGFKLTGKMFSILLYTAPVAPNI